MKLIWDIILKFTGMYEIDLLKRSIWINSGKFQNCQNHQQFYGEILMIYQYNMDFFVIIMARWHSFYICFPFVIIKTICHNIELSWEASWVLREFWLFFILKVYKKTSSFQKKLVPKFLFFSIFNWNIEI